MGCPSSADIKAAIFDMDPSSAPGPDGFSGVFYHSAWDIIGSDVVAAISYFFQTGHLPNGLNSSLVVLIPKMKGASVVDQFRPIVLSNFLFKVVTKILATGAPSVISPVQFGFLSGRRMNDCIAMAEECVNCLGEARCRSR